MSAAIDSELSIERETGGLMDESGYIPSFYRKDPHTEDAVVTENGLPISVHGDELTITKCPKAFRYAIGPVHDGRAEVLPQEEFKRRYHSAIVEYYAEAGEKYDVAELPYEPVPTVRKFVAKKWNEDKSAIVPLGDGMRAAPEAGEPAMLYSPSGDKMISREELEEIKKAREHKENALEAENADLRQRLAAIEEKLSEAPAKPKKEQPTVAAPCGKECKGDFGLRAHMRRCKDCKAAESGPEAA